MENILLVILMVAVTFIPRYLPFALAGKVKLPAAVERALVFVPIAVLTVIITQAVAYREGELAISLNNPYLTASLTSVMIAHLQPRLIVTVITGLLVFVIHRMIF